MRLRVRLWLTRALVAVIVMGSGLNGYLAYVAHDAHAGDAHTGAHADHVHVHGTVSEARHHDHASSQTYVLLCHHDALCQEEPGTTASHIHVSCCVPAAVAPGETALAGIAIPATIALDRGILSPPGQIFYPLFKPPRTHA